jgi:hypothetical protein
VNVRRSIAVAAALVAAPVMSSCGVNFDAQTDQVYNPAVGVNDRAGSVDVLNALVVSGSPGSGTIAATLVNNDQQNADSLRGVAGAGDDSGLTASTGGTTDIPAGGLLNLAEDGRVSIRGEGITPGSFVEITFSFERGKAVTMKVPVVSSSDSDYSDVPLPSGS